MKKEKTEGQRGKEKDRKTGRDGGKKGESKEENSLYIVLKGKQKKVAIFNYFSYYSLLSAFSK